ncbi:MAG: hypothetical protein QW292_14355 [Candidatus Parvarchaeota archaeon]
MGIINHINNIASLASSAVAIHSSARYFSSVLSQKKDVEFTFEIPKTAKVNQVVYVHGTAPPGMVLIYSQNHLERTVFPERDGSWGTTLYFSKPGEYKMIARWQNNDIERTVYVS